MDIGRLVSLAFCCRCGAVIPCHGTLFHGATAEKRTAYHCQYTRGGQMPVFLRCTAQAAAFFTNKIAPTDGHEHHSAQQRGKRILCQKIKEACRSIAHIRGVYSDRGLCGEGQGAAKQQGAGAKK